jgi:transposase-like protein
MALSDDLRKRVVEAVVLGGLSRNAAARRFGVSIASAVRWVTRYKTTGQISPSPLGGDRRSGRIEAHRDLSVGPDPAQPGHHAARDPGAADRQLRRALCGLCAVAFLRPSRDHL